MKEVSAISGQLAVLMARLDIVNHGLRNAVAKEEESAAVAADKKKPITVLYDLETFGNASKSTKDLRIREIGAAVYGGRGEDNNTTVAFRALLDQPNDWHDVGVRFVAWLQQLRKSGDGGRRQYPTHSSYCGGISG